MSWNNDENFFYKKMTAFCWSIIMWYELNHISPKNFLLNSFCIQLMNRCWHPWIKKYPDTETGIFLVKARRSEYVVRILKKSANVWSQLIRKACRKLCWRYSINTVIVTYIITESIKYIWQFKSHSILVAAITSWNINNGIIGQRH